MRLGGPVFGDTSTPEQWIDYLQRHGYRAAYCPLAPNATDDVVWAYVQAAHKADIVIAEVGTWSNPISPDAETRRLALEKCKRGLELADRVGARCCVNISGSRGAKWDGPDAQNLTPFTFDLIVDSVRDIIDSVQPIRTFYTLETMPWAYPDSAESYVRLIEAIDRPQFGVHLDPVNLVCSPQRYYDNAALIRDCFLKLGPYIKSCHGKDIALDTKLTVHLDEVRPGLGNLDYRVFLQELNKLDPGTPLMLEHLVGEEEYVAAAAHVREVASGIGVEL